MALTFTDGGDTPTEIVGTGEVVRPAWMSDAMFNEWYQLYLDAGGAGVGGSEARATVLFRQSPNYETYFPGIKRDDGSIRYDLNPELTYFNNMKAYRTTVTGLGFPNPEIFSEDYIDLIEGDTSPDEFTTRANALNARVMQQGAAIRGWYADNLGIDMTKEGILASLMSNRVETSVLERQLTMAEIGGEGVSRGFDLQSEFVSLLEQEGMDRDQADRTFGAAEALLPALGALARRHMDTSDDFTIEEFTQAAFLDDPEQLARLSRLEAAEQSQFTGGIDLELQRSRATGGLTGLQQN